MAEEFLAFVYPTFAVTALWLGLAQQDGKSWDVSSLDSEAWGVCSWAAMGKPPVSLAAQTFGERVRERRHALSLSQEQLADVTGLHWTFVGQVERGRRNLTLHNILRLAEGLGVNPSELVRDLRSPRD